MDTTEKTRFCRPFRKGRSCRGQALTELVTILVGICVVLLSVILFSVVGIKGVKNVISAREEADRNLASGTASNSGRQISHWINIDNMQGDGMHFTADDEAVTGGSVDAGIYRRELISSDGSMDLGYLATSGGNRNFKPFDLAVSSIFFKAANLTSGASEISDVMEDQKLYDVKKAMQKFNISTVISINDRIFMPNVYSK